MSTETQTAPAEDADEPDLAELTEDERALLDDIAARHATNIAPGETLTLRNDVMINGVERHMIVEISVEDDEA